jgi:type II secretory pathway pseudopilin PulG
MQTTPTTRRARRSAAGFTLVEILISLGIFLIGMTAIVSLFPAAAIIQRETTQEVIAGMAAESAKSIINANQLTYEPPGSPDYGTGDLDGHHLIPGYASTDAIPLRIVMNSTSANSFDNRFPFTIRSYPTGLVDTTAGNGFDAIKACDMHWVPFLQDLAGNPSNPNWVMRLFILEHDSRGDYTGGINTNDPNNFPKIYSVGVSGIGSSPDATGDVFQLSGGTDIEASDVLMDSNGNSHVVVDVNGNNITVLNPIPRTPRDPNRVWFAPRSTPVGSPTSVTNSPAQRVITVKVNLGEED